MSNPFDQNPWQSQPINGPRFGNAYESEPIYPPYGNAYGQSRINQPGFSSTGYNNAWGHTESNKTEYIPDNLNTWSHQKPTYPLPQQSPSPYDSDKYSPLPSQQDAYQYSGTAYGNPPQPAGSAYSSLPLQDTAKPVESTKQSTTISAGPEPWNGEIYHRPSASRFWFRFVVLLASIGHLGFAAGAGPYSGQNVPFYTSAVFYYLFVVAALSIVYSACHVFFYCYRRMLKKPKMNRRIMISLDLVMAVLWGIGVIVEVVKFRCTDGSKFCAFYNVSIFFGFVAFAAYVVAVCWDLFGACRSGKRK